MLTTIFFYLFWASVLAGAVFVGFFMWLNSRDSRIDDRQYDPEFDPQKAVEINAFRGITPEDKIDPAKALRAYAQPVQRTGSQSRPPSSHPSSPPAGHTPSGSPELSAAERSSLANGTHEPDDLDDPATAKNESGIE